MGALQSHFLMRVAEEFAAAPGTDAEGCFLLYVLLLDLVTVLQTCFPEWHQFTLLLLAPQGTPCV